MRATKKRKYHNEKDEKNAMEILRIMSAKYAGYTFGTCTTSKINERREKNTDRKSEQEHFQKTACDDSKIR